MFPKPRILLLFSLLILAFSTQVNANHKIGLAGEIGINSELITMMCNINSSREHFQRKRNKTSEISSLIQSRFVMEI
ncbi:MAG: hypothetical protein EA362_00810 [Saprospirales bacterium]|nr:MAG: hypothetical protein EA362_00810 [Saprospirales bacterium]